MEIIRQGLPQALPEVVQGPLALQRPGGLRGLRRVSPQVLALILGLASDLAHVMQHDAGDNGLRGVVEPNVEVAEDLPAALQKGNGGLDGGGASLREGGVERLMGEIGGGGGRG